MSKIVILLEAGIPLAICLTVVLLTAVLRARPEDLPVIVQTIIRAIRRK